MKLLKYIFIFLLLISIPFFNLQASNENNLRKTFKELRKNSIWPVANTDYDNIISPFGPRWLGRYDWHYGLDIKADKGTKVKAPKKAEVYSIIDDGDDGRTIILKHSFPDNTKFKNRELKYYYTWYLHLDSFAKNLKEGQTIKKGKTIGYVGQTGNASSPHLHFELRVGEVWSQQYNNAGYDSPVNPLMLFQPQSKNMSLSLEQQPTKKQDAEVLYTTSDEQPLLNKVKFQIKDKTKKKGKKIVKQHILNINHRTGFDASSIATLDTPDTTKPYFSPVPSCFSGDHYYINIIIPKKYTKKYLDFKYIKILTVYDIWGRSKKLTF